MLYLMRIEGQRFNAGAGLLQIFQWRERLCDRLFSWEQMNPWQFDHDIIGVDLPTGGVFWMDPALRYATPGVVHPDYTGVAMLQIDSATWKASKGSIPGSSAASNTRKYTYALDLLEEGDAMDVLAEFTGYPAYVERRNYMALEVKEQSKALRERFENAMKSLVVSEAKVFDAADPRKDVSWQVKGSIEREPGRSRQVDPFPGMPWPLWVPSKLDEERKLAIVLPYLSIHTASSQFTVPKGLEPRLGVEMKQQNEFGRVEWIPTYDSSTRKIRVPR